MSKEKKQGLDVRAWIQQNPLKTGAMMCALFAVWFTYKGLDYYGQNKKERDILVVRDALVAKIQPRSQALVASMNEAHKSIGAVNASTNPETVKASFSKQFENAELVQAFSVDIPEAYQNMQKFGFGKLAVLEASANSDQVAMRIISVAGEKKLALAKAVGSDAATQLVYVQLPMNAISDVFVQELPEATYLAVRQDSLDVQQQGDSMVAETAEMNSVKIKQTPWRVVAAAPFAEKGLFDAQGIAELVLAFLFIAAGAACIYSPQWLKKRKHATTEQDVVVDTELTFEQMRAQGLIDKPSVESVPVFNIKHVLVAKVPLERDIFRAYDIRGVVGQNLDAGIARMIGEVVGSMLVEKGLRGMVVGYDGRLSSETLANGLIEGINSAGASVINIGQVPTPLVYFACHKTEFTSGISVTGSHNPPDYNGFKIVIDGHTLSGHDITQIYERIVEKKVIQAQQAGTSWQKDMVPEYIKFISEDIQIDRPLKVVVDCGNGVPGAIAPELLRAIGAEVEEIYCEVDGNFPNHHPDPSDPQNLIDLIKIVERTGADLGLAFDGDGDRLGVVTAQGQIIYPDNVLMIFAEDVLTRHPGAAIIYDVKCTGALQGHILRNGGSPVIWKTGHSFIKAKMKEIHAELAGEMSGHFFFAERWFGFDDGMYAAARLLEILAAEPNGIQSKFDALPKLVSTPELKIHLNEGEQHRFIEQFVSFAKFVDARINLIDGVRADWPDGWGLLRASNTTPVLVARFEANDDAALYRIQALFREQILALNPDLTLPF